MAQNSQDCRREQFINACQVVAACWAERFWDTPRPVAALAAAPAPAKAVPLLTREETAERLRIHVSTLDRLQKSGKIRCEKSGRKTLYEAAEVQRYLDRRQT